MEITLHEDYFSNQENKKLILSSEELNNNNFVRVSIYDNDECVECIDVLIDELVEASTAFKRIAIEQDNKNEKYETKETS